MPRLPSERLTIALQRRTAAHFYGDTADVLQSSGSALDVYGQPSNMTVTTTAITCSFSDKPDTEKWKNYADISQLSAEIRYSGSPAPAFGDQFKLKGRFDGTGYTDTTYEVIGIRDRDNLGVVCALRKVAI